ncbi:MAG TPA: hypothetical protein VHF65_02675 [Nitrososphaera sp.]|nr:hypothetical protein [Nitrososphaera sp.]
MAAGIAVFFMDSLLSWFKLLSFSTVQATIISYGIMLVLIATGSIFIFFGIKEGEHKQKKKKYGVQEEVNSQQESSDEPILVVEDIIEVSETIPLGKAFRDYPFVQNYFLRIRNKSKNRTAESCNAKLVIGNNTSFYPITTYWRNTSESTTVNISKMEDLKLFTIVEEYDRIFFPKAIVSEGHLEGSVERLYKDSIQKELEVCFISKTGRFVQNPYRKKISDIIKEAKREQN